MDIDLLKSTPDDQIEMIMMMHMNKSAACDYLGGGSSGAYPYDAPIMSFSGSEDGSPGGLSQQFNNLCNSSSPNSLHPQVRTISFSNTNPNSSSNNSMLLPSYGNSNGNENVTCYPPTSPSKQTSMAAMREMIFRIAAMQPIYIDPEAVKPPKRRNVRISKDPQSVAARHRRERISERIRILQRLVPGGTKMDTASMLDETIHYVKFLKTQVQSLERAAINNNNRPIPPPVTARLGFPEAVSSGNGGYFPMTARGAPSSQNLQQFISDA